MLIEQCWMMHKITKNPKDINSPPIWFDFYTDSSSCGRSCFGPFWGGVWQHTVARIFNVSPVHLSASQRKLVALSCTQLAGAVSGVIFGCTLGASALYLVPDCHDTCNNGSNAAIMKYNISIGNIVHNQQQNEVQMKEQLLYFLQKVLHTGTLYLP